jgi:acyl-CoA dehydrogenase
VRDPVGVLEPALKAMLETEPLEQKLRKLGRDGKFKAVTARERLAEALQSGQITQQEFDAVTRARKLKRDVIMVDDFDMKLEQHDDKMLQRLIF